MQIDTVELTVEDIVKVLHDPSITQKENLYGLPYSIQNPEGILIKTGIIQSGTQIEIPIKEGYKLVIQEHAVTGDAVIQQYPDLSIENPLKNLLWHRLFWMVVSLFLFGAIVQFTLLLETKMLSDGSINTHFAPYWVLKSFFGTNFANIIVGQFRDLFAMAGMFVLVNWWEKLKSSVSKWIWNILPAIILTAGYQYVEYYLSLQKGGVLDIPDIITFTFPTVSMITLAVYQYIKLRKSNVSSIRSSFFASFPDIALPIIVVANTVLYLLILLLLGIR